MRCVLRSSSGNHGPRKSGRKARGGRRRDEASDRVRAFDAPPLTRGFAFPVSILVPTGLHMNNATELARLSPADGIRGAPPGHPG